MGCGPQETFRSCADIEITRHPLLSNLIRGNEENRLEDESFYNDALLETTSTASTASDSDADYLYENVQYTSSIKKKEALLRKKKRLLEQLLHKLRQLIIQSQRLEAEDQMASPQRTAVSQIQPPREYSYADESGSGDSYSSSGKNAASWSDEQERGQQKVRPWWERIVSNRH